MGARVKRMRRIAMPLFMCVIMLLLGVNVQAALKTTSVPEGRYRLKNLNGKYLTMTDDKNGGTLKLTSLNKLSEKQVFTQAKDGKNSFYTLTAYASSGKRLVNVYATKSSDGKKVVLYSKDTNSKTYKAQRWYWVYDSKNKAYSIRPADNTNLALTVSGSTVKVAKYKKNDKNQLWKYEQIPVTSVKLNYSVLQMKKGTSYTLKATVAPAFATDTKITWKSNKNRVTVNSKGKVVVTSKAKATDIAKITATNNASKKKATCTIAPTSKNIPVTGVSLNCTSCTLVPGETKQIIASIAPVTATNQNVTWKSSNTKVVTVNSSGLLTAKGDGTATITVTTKAEGKTDVCKVTVQGNRTLDLESFNQGYKDWRYKLMGTDDKEATIGMYGCLTTCLAEIENYYNKYVFNTNKNYTPWTISKELKYRAGYLQGSGLWKEGSYYSKIKTDYTTIYNQIKAGKPVLIKINYGETHWLVIYGYKDVKYVNGKLTLSAKNFLVADSGGASGLKSNQKSGKMGEALLSTTYKNYPISLAKVRNNTKWK